ncbi:MAG: glycosyltransferase family protein [Candidatus Micrarchaeota archaeon]|nr:glycosyltransferase family protein [Candidatus Micrarchaeota archaeon]
MEVRRTKVVAVVQARMGSTRLPRKVLAEIAGKPMLYWVVKRILLSKKVSGFIVATTNKQIDDAIEEFARKEGFPIYRGSENDIVDRCYQAALKMGAAGEDLIVRITADCPLVDAKLLDEMVSIFKKGRYDFFSNVNPPTFPDGLDIEMLTFDCLRRLWQATRRDPFLAEWFRTYIVQNPDKFRIGNHTYKEDLSRLRWTVDEKEDLEFVRRIYSELREKGHKFYMDDILRLISKKPHITKINSRFIRDKAYIDALAERSRGKR